MHPVNLISSSRHRFILPVFIDPFGLVWVKSPTFRPVIKGTQIVGRGFVPALRTACLCHNCGDRGATARQDRVNGFSVWRVRVRGRTGMPGSDALTCVLKLARRSESG